MMILSSKPLYPPPIPAAPALPVAVTTALSVIVIFVAESLIPPPMPAPLLPPCAWSASASVDLLTLNPTQRI